MRVLIDDIAACVVSDSLEDVLSSTSSTGERDERMPAGVQAVWNLDQAQRTSTSTREQVCINGLWRWQPADPKSERVPEGDWGYFKVPGSWPGITDYMQKDFQTVHAHPTWKDQRLADVTAAWHQREITIPAAWAGRRQSATSSWHCFTNGSR